MGELSEANFKFLFWTEEVTAFLSLVYFMPELQKRMFSDVLQKTVLYDPHRI